MCPAPWQGEGRRPGRAPGPSGRLCRDPPARLHPLTQCPRDWSSGGLGIRQAIKLTLVLRIAQLLIYICLAFRKEIRLFATYLINHCQW